MFADRMVPLLPQEAHSHVINSVPNKEFEVAYRLDCRNLCADFQEDIEFRFSLGITSLMYRFLGAKGTRQAIMGYSDAVSFNKKNIVEHKTVHKIIVMKCMLNTMKSTKLKNLENTNTRPDKSNGILF